MSKNELALVKKDTVDIVSSKIKEFQNRGEIHFPANYSPENALKSAWLILQETKDKSKRPVLEACNKNSIANALLDMVVQGLNPAKKQGYFIPYGQQLTFQRSYFGTMAVLKRVTDAKDVYAEVVYKDDEFEYEIKRGKKYITKHGQKLENVKPGADSIKAAYCIIEHDDGSEYTEIMTIGEIKKAWTKSKMNPNSEGSTHQEFAGEMAKRTVVNRACKILINSSDDGSLIFEHIKRQDDIQAEAEIEGEIAENANQEAIDIEADWDEEETEQEEHLEAEDTETPADEEPQQEERPQRKKAAGEYEQQSIGDDGPGF